MNKKEIIDRTFNALFTKYRTLNLTKEEVSEVLNISQTTLNRKLKKMEALPTHHKIGGKYLFPVQGISEYQYAMQVA